MRGIAQKVHPRSHPSAIFRYDHGARPNRMRGPAAIEASHHAGVEPGAGASVDLLLETAFGHAADDLGYLRIGGEVYERVDLGHRFREIPGRPGHQAAGEDQTREAPGALELGELEHFLDRLAPRRIDETASVDDDNFGRIHVVDERMPAGRDKPREALGINGVLRTAKRDDADSGRRRAVR